MRHPDSPLPLPPLRLLAVRTVTGATTFIVTRHPDAQLRQIAHVGTALEVERTLEVVTPHADAILQVLREDLREDRLTAFGDRPWFSTDWETVAELLMDFDPATGKRFRLGDLWVGDLVWARIGTADEGVLLRKGTITGIAGRLYTVELQEPVGAMRRCPFPRDALKPHERTGMRVSAIAVREAA